MLQHTKSFHRTRTLVISALVILLAACSAGPEGTTSPTSSASSSSPQTAGLPPGVAIPGVNNINEINFKAASQTIPSGYFDGVNDSTAQRIEVSNTGSVKASGWAILTDESKPADMVLITYGDTNSLVAVAPVNLQRADVVKALKNSAYKNSGWSTTFNASTLPSGNVVLKAWAYNSARKEATQLNYTHEVVLN